MRIEPANRSLSPVEDDVTSPIGTRHRRTFCRRIRTSPGPRSRVIRRLISSILSSDTASRTTRRRWGNSSATTQRSRSSPYAGQMKQDLGYNNQGGRYATSSGNYRGRQYNRTDTPINRPNNTFYQQGGYRQGSRSPSPAQRGGFYPGQAGQYGLNRPSSYSMSPSRFWKMPGTHIPPNFDFKGQPNHCTKCGGQKAHNGDVIFESGHNDMECRKYILYNEKGCMICNALGIKSFHYESECKRNAGFAATMIRPLN